MMDRIVSFLMVWLGGGLIASASHGRTLRRLHDILHLLDAERQDAAGRQDRICLDIYPRNSNSLHSHGLARIQARTVKIEL